MKKRLTVISLVFALLLAFALPLVVQASSNASTEVVYTVPEPPPTSEPEPPEPPAPTVPDYIINIPASITLNDSDIHSGNHFDITWVNNNLVNGEWVTVNLDAARTFTDGVFYLRNGDGATLNQRIACDIYYGTPSNPTANLAHGGVSGLVAQFIPSNMTESSATNGRISFIPKPLANNVPGIYSGTIYFVIEHRR